MDKNSLLQEFKNGLQIFEESYQQTKVMELDEKITKLVKAGKKEDEVLSNFDVSKLIEEVYLENHLIFSKQKKNNFFSKKYDSVFEVIRHVIEVMSKNSVKANMKIIFDIMILIFLVSILKIPFILIRDLGISLLDFFAIPLINNIWVLLIEIVYIIIAVIVFLNIFKKWFEKLKIEK